MTGCESGIGKAIAKRKHYLSIARKCEYNLTGLPWRLDSMSNSMNQQSRLLQLPRELRDKILFYACEGRVFKVHNRHMSKIATTYRYPGLRFDVNLLLVNHQLCDEVMDATTAAYLRNTFHFESPTILKDFALKLSGNEIATIRSLSIDLTALDYDISPSRRWFFALSDVLVDHFLGLKDLHIL